MRIRWGWVLGSVLALACATLPPVSDAENIDCLAKSTCYMVKVDNDGNKFDIEFRLNGVKYGEIGSYGSAVYKIPVNRLIHHNCLVASAKFRDLPNRPVLRSTEECIYPGQYYQTDITVIPFKVWLSVYKNR